MKHVAVYYGPDERLLAHEFESRAKSMRRLVNIARRRIANDSFFSLHGPTLTERDITVVCIDKQYV